jgi:hypothetical protein
MDWNAAAPAAIIGAIAATVGVVGFELALKPAAARKRAARVLLDEIRLNGRLLAEAAKDRVDNPDRVSETVIMADRGWRAVEADIHHLPSKALRPLLLTYAQFAEINAVVSGYSRKADLVQQLTGPQAQPLVLELRANQRLFGEMIVKVSAQCEATMNRLREVVDEGPPDFAPEACRY